MARLDPSIRHAITPPEFGENMLHREHLVDQLHGAIPNKLVAIAAPAGYGKTTLLADFVAHTELPVCWVQVTDADRDLMRLVSVTLASLEKRFRRLRGELDLAAYSGSSPVSLARTIIDLVDQRIPENFILVKDDVHHIHGSESCLEFIDELLRGLPEQMTVFAAGREVLEVSLARLMAEGELSGLGPHDLALDEDQIRRLIRLRTGQELSDTEASRLRESTRGWITGVILSDYGSDKASISDGLPEPLVYEYLASVVLNRQQDDIRRFMLDASVLPIMTAEACNSVLERDDSQDMLAKLADRGLFLTVAGDDPTTYEFHPIFRDLLMETLGSTDPDRFTGLRRKGAKYYREAAPEVAVNLHLDSGDYGKAAEVVEELAPELFRHGRFSTIESWISLFPDPSTQVPRLQLNYSKLLLHRGDLDEAWALVCRLLEVGEDIPQQVLANSLIVKGLVALQMHNHEAVRNVVREFEKEYISESDPGILASYYRLAAREAEQRGDLSSALSHLDSAVDLLRGGVDNYQLAIAYQQQAYVYHNIGNLRLALKATKDAFEIAERYGSPLMRAFAHNDVGQVKYLTGDYEAALLHLDKAKSLARLAGSETFEAHVLYGQGDVYSDMGLTYQAAELYGEGLDIATVSSSDELITQGCVATAVLHRRAGSIKLASEWLQRAISSAAPSNPPSIAVQAAGLVAYSSPEQCLRRLEALLKPEDMKLGSKELTEALHFRALAMYSLGDEDGAYGAFRECLDTVSLSGTEQYLAAELAADEKVAAWASIAAPGDPTLNVVLERVELMNAMRARYLEAGSSKDAREADYRASAFGGLNVVVKGEKVNDKMKPQALQVFIYLLDRGSTERDRLSDEFWPDHPPGRQTANLHMAIYSIRQAIGKEMVQLDGSIYSLSNEVDWRYDVAEFERAFTIATSLPHGDPRRMFALTEATHLYQGPFLPEYFSEWVEERRRELELSYLDVVAANAEEAMRRDAPDRALAPLRDALKVDPYRDDLNRHYLEALGRLDRRSDALMHYQKYASLVREELGLDPSPRVKEVIDSISRAQ